jgi:hypothetical protein
VHLIDLLEKRGPADTISHPRERCSSLRSTRGFAAGLRTSDPASGFFEHELQQ